MNVNQVIDRVKKTTSGEPFSVTTVTGTRYSAPHTEDQGTGVVNAKRYVTGEETTIVSGSDLMVSGAGTAGFFIAPAAITGVEDPTGTR